MWTKRILKGLVVLVFLSPLFYFWALPILRLWLVIRRIEAAMVLPENFKPAELFLARMCQSDPKVYKSDWDGIPPDWTPPELGIFMPAYVDINPNQGTLSVAGRVDGIHTYDLRRDVAHSDKNHNTWILYHIGDGDRELDRFSLPAADQVTEEELVRGGLMELDRRKAARAAGREVDLNNDDCDQDRARLLSQHPEVAKRLGLVPTSRPTTASSK